jgi:glutamyl-tRNA synthetase
VLPYLSRAGLAAEEAAVRAIVRAAGDRIKVAGDILDYDFFFLPDAKLRYDEKEFGKRLKDSPEGVALLRQYRDVLAKAPSFDAAALEQDMNVFLQAENVKLGQVNNAVRVAVTGKGVSFGIFETLAILGRERCLARIDQALARV